VPPFEFLAQIQPIRFFLKLFPTRFVSSMEQTNLFFTEGGRQMKTSNKIVLCALILGYIFQGNAYSIELGSPPPSGLDFASLPKPEITAEMEERMKKDGVPTPSQMQSIFKKCHEEAKNENRVISRSCAREKLVAAGFKAPPAQPIDGCLDSAGKDREKVTACFKQYAPALPANLEPKNRSQSAR
jgi:hypothetical protein